MSGVISHEQKSSWGGIDGRKRVREPESRTAGRIDIFDGGGMGGAHLTTTIGSAAHGNRIYKMIYKKNGWRELQILGIVVQD